MRSEIGDRIPLDDLGQRRRLMRRDEILRVLRDESGAAIKQALEATKRAALEDRRRVPLVPFKRSKF